MPLLTALQRPDSANRILQRIECCNVPAHQSDCDFRYIYARVPMLCVRSDLGSHSGGTKQRYQSEIHNFILNESKLCKKKKKKAPPDFRSSYVNKQGTSSCLRGCCYWKTFYEIKLSIEKSTDSFFYFVAHVTTWPKRYPPD